MAIQYDPKDAESTWPVVDGDNKPIEYHAVLTSCIDSNSKRTGDPMLVWEIEVYNAEGQTRTIKEHVVIPACLFKVKKLAKALGRLKEFESRQFQPEDYINASLMVRLDVEKGEGNFDDKNVIAGYYAPTQHASRPAPAGDVPGYAGPSRGEANVNRQIRQQENQRRAAMAGAPNEEDPSDPIPF